MNFRSKIVCLHTVNVFLQRTDVMKPVSLTSVPQGQFEFSSIVTPFLWCDTIVDSSVTT